MRGIVASCLALSMAIGVQTSPTNKPVSQCLPVVDLGYEKHQALSYDKETDVYKFRNIRYAEPPTKNLRFRAPVPPKTNRKVVQKGAEERTCPQGIPLWQAKAVIPMIKYSNPANPFNLGDWEKAIENGRPPPPTEPPTVTTEDCLFLDVHVPKKVLDGSRRSHRGAPVLVWIHGGGYTLGSKEDTPQPDFNPSGLLAHAAKYKDGMIFVALNYRLGALGFLPGPEVERDGSLNAGLLDQRLALKWVQDHIHLFGGSKERVTVMGESAGGGSIVLHMGADQGRRSSLFSQAVAQSPAIIPLGVAVPSILPDFLKFANASSLSEARTLDEAAIIAGNAAHVGSAPPTTYIYGPVADGDFIPQATDKKDRPLNKAVKVLTGHNKFEGAFFFDPTVKTEQEFKAWVKKSINGVNDDQVKYLSETLYPTQFDGSLGYVDYGTRQMALFSESVIECNFQRLGLDFKGQSYAYEFGVSPGFHIQDLDYTFNSPEAVPFPKAQDALQTAIVSFVQGGVPKTESGAKFPRWGAEGALVNVTADGSVMASSRVNATRCAWWLDQRNF